MLIYEVLNIRDFSKLLRLLFATPQKLLRDPIWDRDPPVGNHCIKKLHFQTSLCEVFAKDKKQHHCGDLGWAVLLFMKSIRIILSHVCRQAIPLISRSVNLMAYE